MQNTKAKPDTQCWYETDDFICNLEAGHTGNHLDITYSGYWHPNTDKHIASLWLQSLTEWKNS